ncbi:MAG: adenylate/guanylate cyclase domain-containing protein [Planctomycetota bacterium]|jgi:class 3 adenylate cyclase
MLDIREEDIDRITEVFHLILNGRVPKLVELPENYPKNEVGQLVEYVNKFIVEYNEFADILSALSKGELDFDPLRSKMHVLQSFKNLHANLRHLTWKTQQIADGDFDQKVDFMGDFSNAFNSMTQQLQSAFAKIEKQNQELQDAWEKSDHLLLRVLPQTIADRLKQGEDQIADNFTNVAILVAEIVDFPLMVEQLPPIKQVDILRRMFCSFDRLTVEKGLQKLKAMGVTYYAIGGAPKAHPDPVRSAAEVALEMQTEILNITVDEVGPFCLRIGIASGPVVGGVFGTSLLGYDLWGPTVNAANAMKGSAPPGSIQVNQAVYEQLKDDFLMESRGEYYVADLGAVVCYLLKGKLD